MSRLFCLVVGFALFVPSLGVAAPPVCSDERLVIEQVASAPAIVTPTGLAVDEQSRVWVIENHTHQRPPSYQGPAHDRIRIFSDFDEKGRARKITTFADGFKNAMAITFGRDGIVYFATRSEIYILRDKDGDGVADEKKIIVQLESKGDYPHNGLSGFAIDGLGDLYFALGENLGATYKLVGSDGSSESGGGEGGSIYRCKPDGSKLRRVATGFWNTFHLTFDAFGRLFAVDNDPDSRGPCRLLHIVQGGDYGYRYRNGRKGLHPFTAWNGELPGTLPMVAGTSEAPSGILAYESNGLPKEYLGNLLVTSWGDHVVDRFTLVPRGASFGAKQQTMVRGGEDFRPVGIVQGPDGAVYLSDWVDKSYPVHGKGAIWRIRMKERAKDDGVRASKVGGLNGEEQEKLLSDTRQEIRVAAALSLAKQAPEKLVKVLKGGSDTRARVLALWQIAQHKELREELAKAIPIKSSEIRAEAVRLAADVPRDPIKDEPAFGYLCELAAKDPYPPVQMEAIAHGSEQQYFVERLIPRLADPDPFLACTALDRLGRKGRSEMLRPHAFDKNPKLRLGVLLALRRAGEDQGRELLPAFLADADPDVRRAAIQWVGEEKLKQFSRLLGVSAARRPVTRDLFEAYLASTDLLAGSPPSAVDEVGAERLIVPVLKDAKQPAEIHALALRMLRPDHPYLTPMSLKPFLDSKEKPLRTEAVRTLALRSDEPSQALLRTLGGDIHEAVGLRTDSVAGLAHSATTPETQKLLLSLLAMPEVEPDTLRSLREVGATPEVEKAILELWDKGGAAKEWRREQAAAVLLALRGSKSTELDKRRKDLVAAAGPRPASEPEWKKLLSQKGDPEAGRRIFFHKNGPRCFTCHMVDGRGARIGPDLSKIGRSAPREKIIESILTPSKEIAPLFVAWNIVTSDGKTHTGLIVAEGSIGGKPSSLTLADATGKIEIVKVRDIEDRQALKTSIMPDNLSELMTPREFVDLIEYLSRLK